LREQPRNGARTDNLQGRREERREDEGDGADYKKVQPISKLEEPTCEHQK